MSGPRTMDFDAIAAAAPLNREASSVRDGSGEGWADRHNPAGQAHWKAPPPSLDTLRPGAPDFTGQRFGRLTAVRFFGATSKKNPEACWLVRCACGDYELRRVKTLRRAGDPDDCCMECKALKALQSRAKKTTTRAGRRKSAALLDRIAAEARR